MEIVDKDKLWTMKKVSYGHSPFNPHLWFPWIYSLHAFYGGQIFFYEVSDSDVKSYNGEKWQPFITQIEIRIYAKTGLNALFQANASLFNFCNKQHVVLDLLQDM